MLLINNTDSPKQLCHFAPISPFLRAFRISDDSVEAAIMPHPNVQILVTEAPIKTPCHHETADHSSRDSRKGKILTYKQCAAHRVRSVELARNQKLCKAGKRAPCHAAPRHALKN